MNRIRTICDRYPVGIIAIIATIVVTVTVLVAHTVLGPKVPQWESHRANTAAIMENGTDLKPVPGHDDLYYSKTTGIVYIVIRSGNENWHTGFGMMSAYYAPNGLPYRYDPATGQLVEISP